MSARMEVVSECPLTVGSVLWQSGPRAWTLTFVAKATFVLAPGESPLNARSQEDVFEHDGYWDDDDTRSLTVASDLVPFKRRPEVVVVGHAYPPGGKRVASLVVRLAISTIDKAIEVRGDQHFTREGALSDPAPFKRMPLRWERAAGGPDTSNPVGIPTGTDARFDSWGRCPLPNLVPVGHVSQTAYDPIEPIGFAPIAPRWSPRAARLAGVPSTFRHDRWNASPLPEHFDAAYFNCAPRDQQLTVFDGTESLLLEHLHPRHPALQTRLAQVRPVAAFEWGKGRRLDLGLACDTLHIDSDRGLAMLTFRGHIALDNPRRAGRIVVALEPPPSPRASVPDWLQRVEDVVSTMAAPEDEGGPTLPFSMTEDEAPTLPKRPRRAGRGRTGTQQGTEVPARPALPFEPRTPPASSPPGFPFRAMMPPSPSPSAPSSRSGAAPAAKPAPGAAPRGGSGGGQGWAEPHDDGDATIRVNAADVEAQMSAPAGLAARPAVVAPPAGMAPSAVAPPAAVVAPPAIVSAPLAVLGAQAIGAAAPAAVPAPSAVVPPAVVPAPPSAVVPPAVVPAAPAAAKAGVTPAPKAVVTPAPKAVVTPAPKQAAAPKPIAAKLGAAPAPLAGAAAPKPPVTPAPPAVTPVPPAPAVAVPSPVVPAPPGFTTSAQALHAAARPELRSAPAELPFVPPPTAAGEPVAPPPLLGALARVPAAVEETVDGDALVEEIEASIAGATPIEEPEPEAPTLDRPLPLGTHPIERCARIAASLARRPDARAEVLRAHALDEPTWSRLDLHYGRLLFEEAERQRNALLKTYDIAYVAQLEEERGPITVEEYARLSVAAERSSGDAVMQALSLPPEAAMRIRRVWIAKIARDMDLGARVRRALQIERDK
jgi:hypothetical protein